MLLSSTGSGTLRFAVTVVVPFMCSSPVPLNVVPLCSVTRSRNTVVPAPAFSSPLVLSPAAAITSVPLCTSSVPVLLIVTQLSTLKAAVPAVLRTRPALVNVGAPQLVDVSVRLSRTSHTPSLAFTTALPPWR